MTGLRQGRLERSATSPEPDDLKGSESMTRLLVPAAVITTFTLAGCSSLQVSTDHDPTAVASMAGYGSYDWMPHPEGDDPLLHNRLLATRVENAVDAELGAKEFRRIDQGTPDFKVGWHASLEGKVDVSTVNNYYGYGHQSWGASGGGAHADTFVREYKQGTLILDVVDARSNKLVWRGTAQAEVSMSDSTEKRESRIRKAVQKLFKGFPPE